MKKVFYFVMKFLLAIVAGMMMMVGAIVLDWSDRVCFMVYFFGTLSVALLLGVFDESAKSRHMSLKDGVRDYGSQAAVFIGTACLFMGTLDQCEEVCDDLWHHGQQAHVAMLNGNETTFEVL